MKQLDVVEKENWGNMVIDENDEHKSIEFFLFDIGILLSFLWATNNLQIV